MNEKIRCFWCNLDNPLYIKYHDEEWGEPNFDETYLFEMLILEIFQSGLTWELILNRREGFKVAFDNFDVKKVMQYDEDKVEQLSQDQNIIKNKRKIKATINNARIFKEIQDEYETFANYLKTITGDEIIYENDKTQSKLSEKLAEDLKKRGMKFIGPVVIYSYLQAIGIINSHTDECYKFKGNKKL